MRKKQPFPKQGFTSTKRHHGILTMIGLVGPCTLLLTWIASLFPQVVETAFSRGLFLFWYNLPSISSLVPFSLSEILALLILLAAIFQLLLFLWRLMILLFRPSQKRFRPKWSTLWNGLSFLLAWFFLVWGLNYYRLSWAKNHGWVLENRTQADLQALADFLIQQASALRQDLPSSPEGTSNALDGPWKNPQLQTRIAVDAYRKAAVNYPLLLGPQDPAKPSFFFSEGLSSLGLSGIYIPWTNEALVNPGPSDWSLAFTSAHENAHKRGWAREDEANFIAWLVLSRSDQADLKYSAYLSAWLYVVHALKDQTQPLSQLDLDPGIKADLQAHKKYWNRFRGPLQENFSVFHNTILKSVGIADGVKSYGQMVDLLFYYWKNHL